MNPLVAFLVCFVGVGVALFIDARKRPMSGALWIPAIWAARVAARPFEDWFKGGSEFDLLGSGDGSTVDRTILIMLMLAAAVVLARRELPWRRWRSEYAWIVVFFLFCGLSLVWSDFLGVGFRRWVRAIGTVMMILVVASEKDPVAAAATVVRRCAIILLPFSVVLIKYFRDIGVYFDFWEGTAYVRGVTTDKNALGRLAMVCALFLSWELLTRKDNLHIPSDRLSRWGTVLLLSIALWLLFISDSKTSLACFVAGLGAMIAAARPFVRNHAAYVGTLLLIAIGIGLALEMTFDVSTRVLAALGRDPTLTTRTFIWDELLALRTNPFVGVGYDTFWLGERLEWFVRNRTVTSAHNGYLETYLELGSAGLLFLACLILAIFGKLKVALATGDAYARLLAAALVVFLLYNWTESSYKPTTFVCFTLLLVAMTPPRPQREDVLAHRGSGARRMLPGVAASGAMYRPVERAASRQTRH